MINILNIAASISMVIIALVSLIISAIAFFYAKRRVTVEEKIEIEKRILLVEAGLKDVPTREELHKMNNSITAFRGDVNVLREEIHSITSLIERLEKASIRREEVLMEVVQK